MSLPLVTLLSIMSFAQQPLVIENSVGARRVAVAEAGLALTGDTQPNQGRTVRICRNERVTGTNLPRRVCRIRFQNSAAQNENREMLRRMQGSRLPDRD